MSDQVRRSEHKFTQYRNNEIQIFLSLTCPVYGRRTTRTNPTPNSGMREQKHGEGPGVPQNPPPVQRLQALAATLVTTWKNKADAALNAALPFVTLPNTSRVLGTGFGGALAYQAVQYIPHLLATIVAIVIIVGGVYVARLQLAVPVENLQVVIQQQLSFRRCCKYLAYTAFFICCYMCIATASAAPLPSSVSPPSVPALSPPSVPALSLPSVPSFPFTSTSAPRGSTSLKSTLSDDEFTELVHEIQSDETVIPGFGTTEDQSVVDARNNERRSAPRKKKPSKTTTGMSPRQKVLYHMYKSYDEQQ